MTRRSIPTIVVGRTRLLREAVSRILGRHGFRIVSAVPRMQEADFGMLADAHPGLLIMEFGDSPRPEIADIARFKEQSSDSRIALLGRHCSVADIAAAFESGANAYFSEATASVSF